MSQTSGPDGGSSVRVLTLGCRLNQSESDELSRALSRAGLEQRRADEPADVTVVNTCTVTADASKSSRKLIRRAVEGGGRVVVTGCYAVAAPESCALPGVTSVVPNKDKSDLTTRILGLEGVRSGRAGSSPAAETVRGSFGVQTGCDVGCTFCIIPSTRGGLASRPGDEVIGGIRAQVAAGVREVALTGVNLGKYGAEGTEELSLAGLVRRVLAEVPELGWLRLSSIEADRVTPELLEVIAADERVCRHLHVPLQAGDDAVLAEMGRPYDTSTYREVVRRVRETLGPDAGITADVLVGFPGETEEAFERGLGFVADAGLTGLHVFRYSPRPDTPAAERPDHVDEGVKRERASRMRALGRELTTAFGLTFLGRPLRFMVERAGSADSPRADGHVQPRLTGTAGNYLKVAADGPAGLVGSIVDVVVGEAGPEGVSGRLGVREDLPGNLPPGNGDVPYTGPAPKTKGDVS